MTLHEDITKTIAEFTAPPAVYSIRVGHHPGQLAMHLKDHEVRYSGNGNHLVALTLLSRMEVRFDRQQRVNKLHVHPSWATDYLNSYIVQLIHNLAFAADKKKYPTLANWYRNYLSGSHLNARLALSDTLWQIVNFAYEGGVDSKGRPLAPLLRQERLPQIYLLLNAVQAKYTGSENWIDVEDHTIHSRRRRRRRRW